MPIDSDKVKSYTDNHVSTDYAVNGWVVYIQRYFTRRTVQQYKMVIDHFCQTAPDY